MPVSMIAANPRRHPGNLDNLDTSDDPDNRFSLVSRSVISVQPAAFSQP
jgi:hypothetical protein